MKLAHYFLNRNIIFLLGKVRRKLDHYKQNSKLKQLMEIKLISLFPKRVQYKIFQEYYFNTSYRLSIVTLGEGRIPCCWIVLYTSLKIEGAHSNSYSDKVLNFYQVLDKEWGEILTCSLKIFSVQHCVIIRERIKKIGVKDSSWPIFVLKIEIHESFVINESWFWDLILQ